jgi:hypothetical protein
VLPAFKPEEALVQLKRALRDLQLSERGNGVDKRGKRVLEWAVESDALRIKLARRLMATPEWDAQVLRQGADQRKLIDEVKKRLARWERED